MKRLFLFFSAFLLFIFSFAQQVTTPETALANYLNNNDRNFAWEITDSYRVNGVQASSVLFVSQKWQGMLWKHQMIILVPDTVIHDKALLFVTGGSIDDNGFPKMVKDNGEVQLMSIIAKTNKALVALLRQVPNQPLYNGLTEDALISYTLDKFRKEKDYSLPLLFPMVKSVISAMTIVQEFSTEKLHEKVTGFVVSGASKRGWTSWLTGASNDPRVIAIAPMVIDMLNLPTTLKYQKEVYGEYSEEIMDYVRLEIPQAISSPFGNSIVTMIDPYSYREKLSLPKMIFIGTNDPYWTVDAVKHYINDIPGHNMLHYIANAGHDMGDKSEVIRSLNAFFALSLKNEPKYPVCNWSLQEKGKNINLVVKGSAGLVKALLWTSFSDTRDFRMATWTSKEIKLNPSDLLSVNTSLKYPKSGYQAFYVDLFFSNRDGAGEFSISTRIYVSDHKQVYVK